MSGSPLDMIWILLVLAVVFYLTWIVTRFVAKRSKTRNAGRLMTVVDRLALSSDKAILLVKIASEYCVIGVSGREMSLIKTLSPEEAEAFESSVKTEAASDWAPAGSAGAVWKGVQSFADRLGLAMKRPQGGTPRPPKPGEPSPDEQSVIDMMNERIRLRKESKWR